MNARIPLRIFGARMRARIVLDQIRWHFSDVYAVEGFYDDAAPAGSPGPGGHPVLGRVEEGLSAMAGGETHAFLALGTYWSWRACEILAALDDRRIAVASLVAPTAQVSPSAAVGRNALVMAGVFIGAEVLAGDLLTAHGGVAVEHHARLGHNVLLGPGTALAGCSIVGDHCFLGTGTRVIPEIRIGAGTMTGAGSVVVRDLPAGVVATGMPAVARRAVRDDDEVPSPATVTRLQPLLQR